MGDVLLHQSVAVGDVPSLLAMCCRSALRAGLSEDKALRFVSAIGLGLFKAIRHGKGRPVLTLVRNGALRLTAQIAVRNGMRPLGCRRWRESWAARLVDAVTVRSNRRETTLGLIVAIRGRERPDQVRPASPPNAGHFARQAERNGTHFT
jgi:hypothetical protein